SSIGPLRADDQYLYFAQVNGTVIHRVDKDGGNEVTVSLPERVTDIAVADGRLYASLYTSRKVVMVDLGGTVPVDVMSAAQTAPMKIELDADYVYFLAEGSNHIFRHSRITGLGGPAIDLTVLRDFETATGGFQYPTGFLVDDTSVWMISHGKIVRF